MQMVEVLGGLDGRTIPAADLVAALEAADTSGGPGLVDGQPWIVVNTCNSFEESLEVVIDDSEVPQYYWGVARGERLPGEPILPRLIPGAEVRLRYRYFSPENRGPGWDARVDVRATCTIIKEDP